MPNYCRYLIDLARNVTNSVKSNSSAGRHCSTAILLCHLMKFSNRFSPKEYAWCVVDATDVQYRRLESNGKIDFHVVQIGRFVKYRFTCLSMVSDTVKWSRMDPIRLSLVKESNSVLLLEQSGCKASESNGSYRSNEVEWTPFD